MAFITHFKKFGRLGLIAVAAGLALAGSYGRVFELYELQTYDWRSQMRLPRPVSKDIVLIDIWNDTLSELGAWPIDREYHAGLVRILKEYGAKAVIFDTLFSEPREHDRELIEAAREARNVYFAYSFSDLKRGKGIYHARKMDSDLAPGYRAAARGTGFVNAKADIDGKRRRVMPVISYRGQHHPQIVLSAAADLFGAGVKNITFKSGRSISLSPDLEIPLDEDGCLLISYAGVWEKTFQHYSYLDILYSYRQIAEGEKPRVRLEALRDKICVVGLTSQGSHDVSPVPVQTVYPMVGSHANILNNLIQRDFIRRAGRLENMLGFCFFGALIALILVRFSPVRALFLTIGTVGIFCGFAVLFFIFYGWWLDLFYPVVVYTGLYAGATLMRMLSEIRKRELIENELKIAGQIQKSFLPESVPNVAGLSLAVYMKPAKAIGGDLYAFLKPSEVHLAKESNDQTGVMVGDVSGKGTPAALFMAKTVSEFKFSARNRTDPSEVLSQLNDAIASESTGGLFVTMTYVILNQGAQKLVLSDAGHLPVVAVTARGGSELLSARGGMPIGVMEGVVFENLERPVESGDVFVLYSDGVSEARNRHLEEYGTGRLQKTVSDARLGGAQDILDSVIGDLNRFMGRAQQHDDITLIIVKIEKQQ